MCYYEPENDTNTGNAIHAAIYCGFCVVCMVVMVIAAWRAMG